MDTNKQIKGFAYCRGTLPRCPEFTQGNIIQSDSVRTGNIKSCTDETETNI